MIATGAQIRARRALLRWRQSDLAEAAGLHAKAVAYWERKAAMRTRREEVGVRRIREAFEAAGVVTFTSPSPGVRLSRGDNFATP
jgi:transcriptional regulator with XRE-family HTH domain